MRKRAKALLILLAACLAVLLVCLLLGVINGSEPTCHGRSLSYWLNRYHDETGEEEREAKEAILHIGTNALPILLRRIQYEDEPHPIKDHISDLLDKLPEWLVPEALSDWADTDPKEKRAAAACSGFEALGVLAAPAVPELVRMMNDSRFPDTAERAMECLAEVGAPAIPHFLAMLQDAHDPRRLDAIRLIGTCSALQSNAPSLIPTLLACLNDPDFMAQVRVLVCLARCRVEPGLVVPAVTQHFQETTNTFVRCRSLLVLSTFGPGARSSEPQIISLLADPDPAVREFATNALHAINPVIYTNFNTFNGNGVPLWR